MKNIAVIFGGKTVEHDISIITAQQVLKNISKIYNIFPIYIDIEGIWWTGENLDSSKTFLNFEKNALKKKKITPVVGSSIIMYETSGKYKKLAKIDAAIICCHGRSVEDGALQGLLESCNIPYTSCKVASSAVCMDKATTKRILKTFKIASVDFEEIYQKDYYSNKFKTLQKIKDKLQMPLIIKPARLGSSVGISICENFDKLQEKIENAFAFDDKLIIEEFVENAKEYCCAVLKVNNNCLTSHIQQVEKGKIYTFEEKYLKEQQKKDEEIDNELQNKILKTSICAYKALECDGVVRIDFLLNPFNQKLYLNEVNAIPGSLAFNLFKVPFRDEIDLLIQEAICSYEQRNKQAYKFSSKAIEEFCKLTVSNKYSK